MKYTTTSARAQHINLGHELVDTSHNRVVAVYRDKARLDKVNSILPWIENIELKYDTKEYDKVTYPKDWKKSTPGL